MTSHPEAASFQVPAGMVMVRKSFQLRLTPLQTEVIEEKQNELLLQRAAKSRYTPDEYDSYWAREHAFFWLFCRDGGLPYVDYLPGRYYTYLRLLDVLEENVNCESGGFGEIGCGSGMALCLLAERGVTGEGLDGSAAAIDFLEDLADFFRQRVIARLGSGYRTNYPDRYFACTFNLGVLEHLDQERQVAMLREMARIAKERVIIFVPNCNTSIYKTMDAMERRTMPAEQVFASHEPAQEIDLESVCQLAGMAVLDRGAIHIAPPADIPAEYLTERSLHFFRSLPNFEASSCSERVEKWRTVERGLPKAITEEFGWFKYAVCAAQ
jgi:SAM-dependent methyltransferase